MSDQRSRGSLSERVIEDRRAMRRTAPAQFQRCAPLGEQTEVDWCAGSRFRDQLIGEVRVLERRLQTLAQQPDGPDFSLQQTCREMIHSRRMMIRRLPG